MEALQEQLELADLRASGEHPAEITAVDRIETEVIASIGVSYEYVDEQRGLSIESTDVFTLPALADPASAFYRLCEDEHISLERAPTELVGRTVSIRWDGYQWEIAVPEAPDTDVTQLPPVTEQDEDLQTALRRARLRSRPELLAQITAVEGVETADGMAVEVVYEYVADRDDITIESSDVFDLPSSADTSYAFYRLCEHNHIPLESAHNDLVGIGIEIYWDRDDGEWTIDVPAESDTEADTADDAADRGRRIDVDPGDLLFVAMGLVYPIIAPLVFLHYWARRGVLRSLAITLGALSIWVLCVAVLGSLLL